MIAKDFFIAKDFRTYAMNFLRQEKSLRDHGGSPRHPMPPTVTGVTGVSRASSV
jgi:hypothetical protein